MKVIKLMSGKQYLVSQEQADILRANINNPDIRFITVGDSDIAIHQIEEICPVETKPYFLGFPMTPDCRYVLKNGEKVAFDQVHRDRIEWREETPQDSIKKIS